MLQLFALYYVIGTVLDISNYVLCRRTFWHTSVTSFSCVSNCEHYLLFTKIRRMMCIQFCILNKVKLHCGKQNFRLFLSQIWIHSLVTFLRKINLIYDSADYSINFLLSYSHLLFYTILFLSEIFLVGPSTSNITNVTNTSLSLATHTSPAVLQISFSYIIFSKFGTFIISLFHKTPSITMKFGNCDR
jgi:hypothetical protein